MPKHLITKNKDDSIIEIKFLDNNSLFKKESVYSIRNEIETVAEANKGKEIYVLCRYNLDIARLSRNFDTQNIKEELTRQIEFMSAKTMIYQLLSKKKKIPTN